MRKTYYAKIIKERGENMQDAKKRENRIPFCI